MEGIGSFLNRYKNFTPPARALVRAVTAALQEVLGITVAEQEVRIVSGVAHVAGGGPQKSEILLHKKEILASAQGKAGESLRDIR